MGRDRLGGYSSPVRRTVINDLAKERPLRKDSSMNPAIVPIGKTFMNTGLPLFAGTNHRVADMAKDTVTFGRKEMTSLNTRCLV